MRFDDRLYADDPNSIGIWIDAQAKANENGSPVAVLSRNGWLAICEEPPDDMEPSPLSQGWTERALIEPMDGAA